MSDVRYGLRVRRVAPHRWRWLLTRFDDGQTWTSGNAYRNPGRAWAAAIACFHAVSRAPASATSGTKPVVVDRRTWQGSFIVPKEEP